MWIRKHVRKEHKMSKIVHILEFDPAVYRYQIRRCVKRSSFGTFDQTTSAIILKNGGIITVHGGMNRHEWEVLIYHAYRFFRFTAEDLDRQGEQEFNRLVKHISDRLGAVAFADSRAYGDHSGQNTAVYTEPMTQINRTINNHEPNKGAQGNFTLFSSRYC